MKGWKKFVNSSFKFLKRFLNITSLKYFLSSLKAFLIELLSFHQFFWLFKKRKTGISVLIPTQNEEFIVRLSILSFIDFADEIIVVDNGSIDKTKKIVLNLAIKYPKVKFYDRPELPELYHNRQFALRKSRYRWICRFDSDYVAYTEGENDIYNLRQYLLKLKKGIIPKCIALNKVNIDGDFWHTRKDKFSSTGEVIRGPEIRIYEYFPFFTFARFGRREYGGFQYFMKKIILKKVYYMHATIKSDMNLFLRSERSNWRENGDYRKYPTLFSYIKDIIKEKYNTTDLNTAKEIFLKRQIYSKENYIKYDPTKYLPYPTLIEEELKKDDVFKLPF